MAEIVGTPLNPGNFRTREAASFLDRESLEFKDRISVREHEVPELAMVHPGNSVELIIVGKLVEIDSTEEGTKYHLEVNKVSYMDRDLSLEQARKEAIRATKDAVEDL